MWVRRESTKNVAISLGRDNSPGLASNLATKVINKFEIRISGKGAEKAGKWFHLVVSNEELNDIIKIIKSLEDPNALIDGITETVKHESRSKNVDCFLLW